MFIVRSIPAQSLAPGMYVLLKGGTVLTVTRVDRSNPSTLVVTDDLGTTRRLRPGQSVGLIEA